MAAIWNLRAESPFMAEYQALLRRFSREYSVVESWEESLARLRAHPRVEAPRDFEVPNAQLFDFEGLRGRAWSSSYVFRGVKDREGFDAALRALFDAHARDGVDRVPLPRGGAGVPGGEVGQQRVRDPLVVPAEVVAAGQGHGAQRGPVQQAARRVGLVLAAQAEYRRRVQPGHLGHRGVMAGLDPEPAGHVELEGRLLGQTEKTDERDAGPQVAGSRRTRNGSTSAPNE